jgi:hypothetical protein
MRANVKALLVSTITVALLAGCGGRSNINAGYTGKASTAGGGTTSTTGGSVGVNMQSGPAAAAVIGVVVVGAALHAAGGSEPMEQRDTLAPTPTNVELDRSRKVLEVDCSQPIEDYSANIKCK